MRRRRSFCLSSPHEHAAPDAADFRSPDFLSSHREWSKEKSRISRLCQAGFALGALAGTFGIAQAGPTVSTALTPALQPASLPAADAAFVDDLEKRTFNWFWETGNPKNGLVPDRAPLPNGAASIASVGFGLTAYGIGVERHYITRQQAVDRTLTTLRFLASLPQNDHVSGAAGYKGFFYHFLDPNTGLRVADWSELSSVDTALLMGACCSRSPISIMTRRRKRKSATLQTSCIAGSTGPG